VGDLPVPFITKIRKDFKTKVNTLLPFTAFILLPGVLALFFLELLG
jgi:hypothetical protein